MAESIRVDVSALVLRWVLERSRRAGEVSRRFPGLAAWLTGEKKPTLRQLEHLAKATHVPLGYMFLPEPPKEELPLPYYRTIGREPDHRPSPELIDTVQTMARRQEWMRDYLIEEGHDPLPFVGSVGTTEDPRQIAPKMRVALALGQDWASKHPTWTDALRELREKTEDAGVLVTVNSVVDNNTHRKLDPTEFRGFVIVDEYAPLVFINSADGKAAQMFTLAHELVHLWLGASAIFDLRELQPADTEIERACNRVAAEFLVPESEIRSVWPLVAGQAEPFQAIARHFKVSELVAARRALDVGLITRHVFLDFYAEYQEKEHAARPPGRGDFYLVQNLRIGRRLGTAVVGAVRQGRLLHTHAYELVGLRGKAFDKYAEYLGLEGA